MTDQIKDLAQEIAFDYDRQFDTVFIKRIELSIIGHRATIIRQDYNKTRRFPDSLVESFCVPMTLVSETECCYNGSDDCKVWRSVNTIPPPVRTYEGSNFIFVGNTNGGVAYIRTTPEAYVEIKKAANFQSKLKFYTYYNNYIYYLNSSEAINERIRVRYVPDNPKELLLLKSCEGKPCIDEINLSQDMKRLIKIWIKEELSGKSLPKESDIQLDGNK